MKKEQQRQEVAFAQIIGKQEKQLKVCLSASFGCAAICSTISTMFIGDGDFAKLVCSDILIRSCSGCRHSCGASKRLGGHVGVV